MKPVIVSHIFTKYTYSKEELERSFYPCGQLPIHCIKPS